MISSKTISSLKNLLGVRVLANEPMTQWTSFKCLGKTRLLIFPKDVPQLCSVIQLLSSEGLRWEKDFYVIGKGSNLLFLDQGYPGIILNLQEGFSSMHILKEDDKFAWVKIGAGVFNYTLLKWLRERGLSGFGFADGIPGSIGGGIQMNAGTKGRWFSDLVTEIEGVTLQGEFEKRKVLKADFGYRQFRKGKDLVITAGLFQFQRSSSEVLDKEIRETRELRKNQPLEFPSFGSVFLNPPNQFAGELIEKVGLKGKRMGDAQFSEKHANFIVNRGDAKTVDVLILIREAQKLVKEKMGISLLPEVRLIGGKI